MDNNKFENNINSSVETVDISGAAVDAEISIDNQEKKIENVAEFLSSQTLEFLKENQKLINEYIDNQEVVNLVENNSKELEENEKKHQEEVVTILEKIRRNVNLINSIRALFICGSLYCVKPINKILSANEKAVTYLVPEALLNKDLDDNSLSNLVMIYNDQKFELVKSCTVENQWIQNVLQNKPDMGEDLKIIYKEQIERNNQTINDELLKIDITKEDSLNAKNKLKQINEIVFNVKEKARKHIKSNDFLKKLSDEMKISKAEAVFYQIARLKNINRLNINIVSLAEINLEINGKPSGNTLAYYDGKNNIYIPFDVDINTLEESIMHEILHGTTYGNEGILEEIQNKLRQSTLEGTSDYLSDPGERLVRKQILDMEMDRLGILKYGEKFTFKHWIELKQFYNEGKLSPNCEEIIETTSREDLEIIINEIAQTEDGNKNYYPPEWHLNKNDNNLPQG